MLYFRDGSIKVHEICDLAIPSPDGKFFVVRDLSGFKEIPGRKGESLDAFYPTDTIKSIEITTKRYAILPADGSRGEEVLDKSEEIGKIISSGSDPSSH